MKSLTAFKLCVVACVFVYALTAAGCATVREHPAYAAVGTALVLGSIAATIEANSHGHGHASAHKAPPGASTLPVQCQANPSMCT